MDLEKQLPKLLERYKIDSSSPIINTDKSQIIPIILPVSPPIVFPNKLEDFSRTKKKQTIKLTNTSGIEITPRLTIVPKTNDFDFDTIKCEKNDIKDSLNFGTCEITINYIRKLPSVSLATLEIRHNADDSKISIPLKGNFESLEIDNHRSSTLSKDKLEFNESKIKFGKENSFIITKTNSSLINSITYQIEGKNIKDFHQLCV